MRAAIRAALAELRRVEAAIEVSRGMVALDGLEVLLDGESVGLLDFGTVGWGILLFDRGEAARACESGAADFDRFLASHWLESPLREDEYHPIPGYRELAVVWRIRVASWYAFRQDSTGRWRGETYRLLSAVGGRRQAGR